MVQFNVSEKIRMAQFISFHTFLDRCDWKINPVQNLLLDSINEVIDDEIPLTKALKSEKCSLAIINFLLDHGANVNYRNRTNQLPPVLYFISTRPRGFRLVDEDITATLLKKGAQCKGEFLGRTFLCHALRYGATKRIVNLFLNAGCLPIACRAHGGYVLHCIISDPNLGLQEGVLEILIDNGAEVSCFMDKNSPICLALRANCRVEDIQLLMRKGIALDSCREHSSPWFCATDCRHSTQHLKTGIVKLILANGFPLDVVNKSGCSPLLKALLCCRNQAEAIELMIKEYGVHDTLLGGNLLNIAVQNPHCNLAIVKLLVNSGLSVLQRFSYEGMPLHSAIEYEGGDKINIIKYLLEKGSPLEFENGEGFTPLKLAVEHEDSSVAKLLLDAGAAIDKKMIDYAFSDDLYNFDCLKVLLKFSYLRDLNFEISKYIKKMQREEACSIDLYKTGIFKPTVESAKVIEFVNQCVKEVLKMDSDILNCKHSLRDFLNGRCCHPMLINDASSESSKLNFISLLKIMTNNAYPIFFDVISAQLDEELLKIELQNRFVYTALHDGTKIRLNNYSVCWLTRYLSHAELLSMIIAFDC